MEHNTKLKYRYQAIGLVVGGINGFITAIVCLVFGEFVNEMLPIIILPSLVVIGVVIGFFTGRYLYKRKLNTIS